MNIVTLCRLKWVFSSIDTFIPCIRFQITWACSKLGRISNPLVSNCKEIKKGLKYILFLGKAIYFSNVNSYHKVTQIPATILKNSKVVYFIKNLAKTSKWDNRKTLAGSEFFKNTCHITAWPWAIWIKLRKPSNGHHNSIKVYIAP